MKFLTVVFILFFSTVTFAENFYMNAGTITATINTDNTATITVTGIGNVGSVEQYLTYGDKKGGGWKKHILKGQGNSFSITPIDGPTFQLQNDRGEYAFISPEVFQAGEWNAVKLIGVEVVCFDKDLGCKFRVQHPNDVLGD